MRKFSFFVLVTMVLAISTTSAGATGTVQKTPSGLQYKEIKIGEGAQPQAGQKIQVH
jgi:FKBP-type peptidyl-prolyl cis-trans isomerase